MNVLARNRFVSTGNAPVATKAKTRFDRGIGVFLALVGVALPAVAFFVATHAVSPPRVVGASEPGDPPVSNRAVVEPEVTLTSRLDDGKAMSSDQALSKSLEAAEKIGAEVARGKVMADIAALRAIVGNAAGAAETLERAAKLADGLNGQPEWQVSCLCRIAVAQVRMGRNDDAAATFRKAMAVARSSSNSFITAPALGELSEAMIAAGDPSGGWKVWSDFVREKPEMGTIFRSTSARLAASLGKAGDFPRAREALAAVLQGRGAELSEDGYVGAEGGIAEGLFAKGEKPEANKILASAMIRARALPVVQQLTAPKGVLVPKASALVILAEVEVQVGDTDAARRGLEEAQTLIGGLKEQTEDFSLQIKAICLARVARVWATLGQPERSQEALRQSIRELNSIRENVWKDQALAEIGLTQAGLGDETGLGKTLSSIGWQSWSKIERIAEVGVGKGLGKEIAAIAEGLHEPLLKSRAYLGLARGLTSVPQVKLEVLRAPDAPRVTSIANEAVLDLDALIKGLAGSDVWKTQKSWMVHYVNFRVRVNAPPNTFVQWPDAEVINAGKGKWLYAHVRQATSNNPDAIFNQWMLWKDGKYFHQSGEQPLPTSANPSPLASYLWYPNTLMRNSFSDLVALPVPPKDRITEQGLMLPGCLVANKGEYHVRPQLEDIDGSFCHVIDRPGADVIWVDVKQGYQVRRRTIFQKSGRPLLEMRATDFRERAPGVWLPTHQIGVSFNQDSAPPEYQGRVATVVTNRLIEARFNDLPDSFFSLPAKEDKTTK